MKPLLSSHSMSNRTRARRRSDYFVASQYLIKSRRTPPTSIRLKRQINCVSLAKRILNAHWNLIPRFFFLVFINSPNWIFDIVIFQVQVHDWLVYLMHSLIEQLISNNECLLSPIL